MRQRARTSSSQPSHETTPCNSALVNMALHDHYGIICVIADDGRVWCEHIDFVLGRIAEVRPDTVQYLGGRLAAFASFVDGVGVEGGFVLGEHQNAASGYIALKAVANNNVEDMRYTIAHELAHACHLLRAADMDAAQGTKTDFTHRQREEAADKIVADDWGLPVPERAEMKPGGVYDLVDALNAIQTENTKEKTKQGD
jgi:hypothetical protein